MSRVLIDHNNRLGDHLICHGIVREYARRFDQVGLFTIPRCVESVAFMFRDLPNLQIELVGSGREKTLFKLRNRFHLAHRHYDMVRELYNDQESGVLFERQFYQLADVPFEKKWENFFFIRDSAREEALYKEVAPRGAYALVHEDSRYPMRSAALPKHLSLVRVSPKTANVFDWCQVIENAKEIHVIDSSLMFLVDLLPYVNASQKLVIHRYSRQPNVLWNMPILKKEWDILL